MATRSSAWPHRIALAVGSPGLTHRSRFNSSRHRLSEPRVRQSPRGNTQRLISRMSGAKTVRIISKPHLVRPCRIIVALAVFVGAPHLASADPNGSRANQPQSSFRPYRETGSTRVFDNAFLDRMFGKQREATQPGNHGAREGQSNLPSAIAPRTIDDPSLDPNRSFIIGIQRNTSAKQAAALRLAEKGRQLLRAGERERAITYLERALSLHSSPYIHFYLARAHYELGRFRPSLDFLEVAESQLTQQPSWIGEIGELKRKVSTHDTRQGATIGRGMELASRN